MIHMHKPFCTIDVWYSYENNEYNYRNTPLVNGSINVMGYVMHIFGLLDG